MIGVMFVSYLYQILVEKYISNPKLKVLKIISKIILVDLGGWR
jgi:hypothetical protein